MTRLSFNPVGDSYLWVLVVALVLLGLLAVGPIRGRAAGLRRAALIALRAAVITLVILAMLRPTVIYTEVKKQSAVLVLLLDQSLSMSVGDAIGGKTRWDELRETVAGAEDALAALAEQFGLKVYTFDAEVHPAEVDGGKISLPESPEGKQTAIGDALDEVLRREGSQRLLAVILGSDGAQRTNTPHALPPQTAASQFKRLGYPLFTFAFGQSLGPGQARDVRVENLLVNPTVFEKNELAVEAQLRVSGYLNREISVRLRFETPSGKMEEVQRETVMATEDGQLLSVTFSHAPEVSGERKLTVEVVGEPGSDTDGELRGLEGELVTTNNKLSTFVNVLGGGLNVLYLEGTYRVEQKFLRRALDAAPNIHVDYVRVDAQKPETWPGDLSERFQAGEYDVYILGDVDSIAFRGNELKDLREAVDQGAGLIMLGGFHSFGPGGYAGTPLANVLPVVMDDRERQRFVDPIRTDVHISRPLQMQPTELGLRHFALMLAGGREENQALWAKLPPLEGANRFSLSSLAAGALVLVDAGPNVPLLVAHNYGNGRVMAFAGDSTWRWSMRDHQSEHKRFWRQVILWLAKKDQAIDGNVWVRLDKRRFAPGERVRFATGAESATGEPIADAHYEVRIVPPKAPDGNTSPLSLASQNEQMEGWFRETHVPGDYRIEVAATHEGMALGSARARFLVFEQNLELDNPVADADSLQSLAAITDGGKFLPPEKLPELIEQLARETESLEVEQESKKTFWDTWSFFLLLVGLLGVEWFLRKRWGLV